MDYLHAPTALLAPIGAKGRAHVDGQTLPSGPSPERVQVVRTRLPLSAAQASTI